MGWFGVKYLISPFFSILFLNRYISFTITTHKFDYCFSDLCCACFSQPRILMAMARDGLLPSFFSDVNKHTQVPVKSTILTGICAAVLAFCMDVSQLAGMVNFQSDYYYSFLARLELTHSRPL